MPSGVRGAASPWFTGAGSDLLVTTCELKVPFKLQLTDHGQTTNRLWSRKQFNAPRGLRIYREEINPPQAKKIPHVRLFELLIIVL